MAEEEEEEQKEVDKGGEIALIRDGKSNSVVELHSREIRSDALLTLAIGAMKELKNSETKYKSYIVRE